jgi:hypothetical protein
MSEVLGIHIVGADGQSARFLYPANVIPIQVFEKGDIGVILPGETDLTKVQELVSFESMNQAIAWATKIIKTN